MLNINLNITADPKLMALLEIIAKSNLSIPVQGSKGIEFSTAQPPTAPVAAPVKPKKTVESSSEAKTTVPKAEPVAASVSNDHTLESVRALAKEKKSKGVDVKALLLQFGVEGLTSLSNDKYADFVNELNKL